jgi:protein required for attachment to host cells
MSLALIQEISMKETYVIVADASQARLYSLQQQSMDSGNVMTRLSSMREFDHPERRLRPSERLSDSRPGTHRAYAGGPAHGLDDRRDNEEVELDRRFAARIMDEARDALRDHAAARLIVAASPRMLGLLRKESELTSRDDLELIELDKDLTKLSVSALHDYLAKRDALPERGRAQ